MPEERLSGSGRGPHRTGGGCAVPFGLIFVAVGVGIILVGTKTISVDPSTVHAPYWVLAVVGVIFALAGLAVVGSGITGMRRKAQIEALIATNPNLPCLRDYPWDPAGVRSAGLGRIVGGFVVAGFMAIFLVPFHWWAITDPNFVVVIVVSIFDLVTLAVVGHCVYLAMRLRKYGSSSLRFGSFPFHPGQLVELFWTSTRGLGAFNKIVFTLRQIREQREVVGTGKNRRTVYRKYAQWSDTYTVEGPDTHEPGAELAITFLLPETGAATTLSDDPPSYWELEMQVDAPGVDFRESYLVPVYAKGGA